MILHGSNTQFHIHFFCQSTVFTRILTKTGVLTHKCVHLTIQAQYHSNLLITSSGPALHGYTYMPWYKPFSIISIDWHLSPGYKVLTGSHTPQFEKTLIYTKGFQTVPEACPANKENTHSVQCWAAPGSPLSISEVFNPGTHCPNAHPGAVPKRQHPLKICFSLALFHTLRYHVTSEGLNLAQESLRPQSGVRPRL